MNRNSAISPGRASVASRFAVAFGVAGVILLGLVAAAAISLLTSRATAIEVTHDDLVRLRAGQGLLAAFYGMQLGEHGFLTYVDPVYLEKFRSSAAAADLAVGELRGKGVDPSLLATIAADLEEYRRVFQKQEEVLTGKVVIDDQAAFFRLMSAEGATQQRLETTLTALAHEQIAHTQGRVGLMTLSLGRSVGLVLFAFLVALGGLLFTYVIGRGVAQDLRQLTLQVREVASTGSLAARIEVVGAAEFAELAGAFNLLLEGQGAIDARAREIASGNLDGALTGTGQLADTFKLMIASLRSTTRSLERAAQAEREAKELLEARVHEYREFIDALAEGELSGRLTATGDDDLARLGTKLNSLAGRLEQVGYETRAAAAMLAQSEESFRSLSEQLPVAVSIYQDEQLVWANSGALKVLGATTFAQVKGSPPLAEPSSPHERELNGLDGVCRSVELSTTQLVFQGRPAVASIAVDVTERKALWRKMHFNERMVSLGTLAAGVAHEINNPMAFVSANLSYVNEVLAELTHPDRRWSEVLAALAETKEGAKRVATIVKDLKAFAREEPASVATAVNVRPMVEFSVAMARKAVADRARLVTSLEPVPAVSGAEGPLGQVFLNLLMNAAQAIPPGRPNDNVVEVGSRVEADGRVAVFVRDTGSGMGPEVRKRLFDPFFSTKPVGEGTGLGLSICLSIVRGAGGEIRVESEPEKGSTFTVLLRPA